MRNLEQFDIKKDCMVAACAFLFMMLINLFYSADWIKNLQVISCCVPQYSILSRTSAVFVLVVLQYYHAEHNIYFFKNIASQVARYKEKKQLFRKQYRRILAGNVRFVLMLLVGSISSAVVSGIFTMRFSVAALLLVLIRAYGLYCIVAIIQVVTLIYFEEAKSFGVIVGITILLTFFSGEPLGMIQNLWTRLVCWLFIYCMGVCGGFLLLGRLLVKEWGQYAN